MQKPPLEAAACEDIAAMIFPVDAERETGFRRYTHDEIGPKVLKENARKLLKL
jgi:hypothetical protein